MRSWNVLATAIEGERAALQNGLRRLARFGGGGYRNILVADVDDVPRFLDDLGAALSTDARLRLGLARVVPVETTLRFDPDDAVPALAAAAEVFLDRLAGGSFYVRLERRGLKGTIHSALVERGVGEHLYRRLEEQGRAARVDFAGPDYVLAIETLGDHAGLGLISRALRERHPFVRIS
jgi:tRNA(Ser,Leu) C12 N-acetylase TAN1